MVALRTRMRAHLWKWREDLPPGSGWSAFFADCPRPALHDIPADVTIENGASVWPGRLGAQHHHAPEGSHICRPFEGLEPEDVRVVVLGKDPYPAIERATGRAFEDGIPDADGRAIRPALRNLGKSARTLAGGGEEGRICPPRPGRAAAIRAHFDNLRDRGVLFVNVSWTFTRTDEAHKAAHRILWQPVTSYLLREVAGLPGPQVIFLLLGNDAKAVFDQLALNGVREIRHVHPTSWGGRYFQGENPLRRVNDALQEFGHEPIDWWTAGDDGVQA